MKEIALSKEEVFQTLSKLFGGYGWNEAPGDSSESANFVSYIEEFLKQNLGQDLDPKLKIE